MFVTCITFYSLVVCVYKNEVITHYSNYQEIDKQNGKGFIIDLFTQDSRLFEVHRVRLLFMF